VTGVQTCALPISPAPNSESFQVRFGQGGEFSGGLSVGRTVTDSLYANENQIGRASCQVRVEIRRVLFRARARRAANRSRSDSDKAGSSPVVSAWAAPSPTTVMPTRIRSEDPRVRQECA